MVKKFDRYRKTSLLCYEPHSAQVSALLLAVGNDSEYINDSFTLNGHTYNEVIIFFYKYLAKSLNVIWRS